MSYEFMSELVLLLMMMMKVNVFVLLLLLNRHTTRCFLSLVTCRLSNEDTFAFYDLMRPGPDAFTSQRQLFKGGEVCVGGVFPKKKVESLWKILRDCDKAQSLLHTRQRGFRRRAPIKFCRLFLGGKAGGRRGEERPGFGRVVGVRLYRIVYQ